MKTVSVKLPDTLVEQITALAVSKGESRSSLVRKAVESLVNSNFHELSCLDLAKDLAGAVFGPEDLSVNPAHMNGYGK
jgi:Arc/MetJ-type ribon-helix-helix transcriptional regulator